MSKISVNLETIYSNAGKFLGLPRAQAKTLIWMVALGCTPETVRKQLATWGWQPPAEWTTPKPAEPIQVPGGLGT